MTGPCVSSFKTGTHAVVSAIRKRKHGARAETVVVLRHVVVQDLTCGRACRAVERRRVVPHTPP